MRFVLFVHSLVSDWNHGNAHFLRGIVRALQARGHQVRAFEPATGWSRAQLLADQGEIALRRFARRFPDLQPHAYDPDDLDLDAALEGADVVLVHEWNEPALIARIGRHRRNGGRYLLLFHDTHHRSVTDADAMRALDLEGYDGVLAFGAAVREAYLRQGWARRAWTWHEAADTSVFRPCAREACDGDLVWVGNWGDDERTAELREFLLEPVRRLGLRARVHGVRYPEAARRALADAGIDYGGWLANADVPRTFARHRVTVHVPRRPYVEALPGRADDPGVRGARLRHPAGLVALERRRGPVPAGRRLPGRERRRRDGPGAATPSSRTQRSRASSPRAGLRPSAPGTPARTGPRNCSRSAASSAPASRTQPVQEAS